MELGEKRSGARVGRLFLALLMGFSSILLIVFLAGSGKVLKRVFSANSRSVALLFLISLGVILVDSLRTKLLIGGLGKTVRYSKALENSVLGFYISAITPFSAGGQPFQIYHLTRNGLGVDEASTVVGLKFVTSFSVSVLLGILALFEYSDDIRRVPAVGPVMCFGITLTVTMYLFFLALALGGRFAEVIISSKVISYPIAFLLKKDREDLKKVVVEKVRSYTRMMRGYWKKASFRFILNVILSFVMIILMLSTSYMAMIAVCNTELDYTEVLGLQVAMNMVVYFLPTPGSSGGIEGMFYLVFSNFMRGEYVASALIVWRFFTHYMTMAIGIFVMSRYIKGKTR